MSDIKVNKGVAYISQANIEDQRLDADLCGIVTGAFAQINATNLFAQFTSAFTIWFESIKNDLSGDIAGNLLLLINKNKTEISTKIFE